ncbi:serine protease [Actinomadura soli]|uniref:Serine protease n=1 Tax=Actinomadura soli TaxID=2508997 RepID=A0A5C4JBU3_9ACTN|nr:S1 family peptidase [Actinomadura soli]TMR01060.1 serine protease [Actinomadura soli]
MKPLPARARATAAAAAAGLLAASLATAPAAHASDPATASAAAPLSQAALGGDAIHTAGTRCVLGFNLRKGDAYYFVTAGHCARTGGTWTDASGGTLGVTGGSSFPGNDYGIVRYTSPPGDTRGGVRVNGEFYDIIGVATAQVGRPVTVTSPSGTRTGQVRALNQTVNHPEGTVGGLIRISVCAQPGDSGAPVFADHLAIGILVGGDGRCPGGTSFVQPIGEPLDAYGLEVY